MKPTLLYLGAQIPQLAVRQRQEILARTWQVSEADIEVVCLELFLGQRGPSTECLIAERLGEDPTSQAVQDERAKYVEVFDPRVNARAIVCACLEQLKTRGYQVLGIELPKYVLDDDRYRRGSTFVVSIDCTDSDSEKSGDAVEELEVVSGSDEPDEFLPRLELLRANTPVPLLLPRIKISSLGAVSEGTTKRIDRTDPFDDGTAWPDSEVPIGAFHCLQEEGRDLFDDGDNPVFSLIGYEQRTVI